MSKQIGKLRDRASKLVNKGKYDKALDTYLQLEALDAVVETRDTDHADEIMKRLAAAGFPARRLHDSGAKN